MCFATNLYPLYSWAGLNCTSGCTGSQCKWVTLSISVVLNQRHQQTYLINSYLNSWNDKIKCKKINSFVIIAVQIPVEMTLYLGPLSQQGWKLLVYILQRFWVKVQIFHVNPIKPHWNTVRQGSTIWSKYILTERLNHVLRTKVFFINVRSEQVTYLYNLLTTVFLGHK